MPVLTLKEAAQMKAQWDQVDGRQKADLFRQWGKEYGDYLPRALVESQVGLAGYFFTMPEPVDIEMARALLMADSKKGSDYKDLDKSAKDDINGWLESADGFLGVQREIYRNSIDPDAEKQSKTLLIKVAYL